MEIASNYIYLNYVVHHFILIKMFKIYFTNYSHGMDNISTKSNEGNDATQNCVCVSVVKRKIKKEKIRTYILKLPLG